jgi:hypothetical protein
MLDNSITKLATQKILVEAVTSSFLDALTGIKGLESLAFTGAKIPEERIHTLVLESAMLVGILHADLRRASRYAGKDPHLIHGTLIASFTELGNSLSSLFARGEQLNDWATTTEARADAGIGASYRIVQELIAALRAQ